MLAAWMPLVQILAICMMRPLGVMLLLPVMGTRMLGSALARNALAMLIALPMVPHALTLASLTSNMSTTSFFAMCITEVVVGLYIGFIASIPFWAIDAAGSLIDTVRGAGMAEILNPTSGEQTSLFSLLFLQLLAALFFTSGGFNLLLEAIYRSYQLLPMGKSLSWDRSMTNFIISQWRILSNLGVGFALPAIMIMVLLDLALGLINRTTEQLDVFFLAMPIKTLLACLMLVLGMNFTLNDFIQHFRSIWLLVQRLLGS